MREIPTFVLFPVPEEAIASPVSDPRLSTAMIRVRTAKVTSSLLAPFPVLRLPFHQPPRQHLHHRHTTQRRESLLVDAIQICQGRVDRFPTVRIVL